MLQIRMLRWAVRQRVLFSATVLAKPLSRSSESRSILGTDLIGYPLDHMASFSSIPQVNCHFCRGRLDQPPPKSHLETV